MSMQVREGQRTPFRPEIWDQYDTHPGHPEPELRSAMPPLVTQGCGETAMFGYVADVSGYGSSQYRELAVANGDGPQVFKSVNWRAS